MQLGPPPPIRRSTRPDVRTVGPPSPKRSEPEGIAWSSLSPNDKSVFFGLLDEYFGVKESSLMTVNKVQHVDSCHVFYNLCNYNVQTRSIERPAKSITTQGRLVSSS